ncbi:MAG: FG-GAP-like repeat-containing protein [Nannocystaceae bacterium]
MISSKHLRTPLSLLALVAATALPTHADAADPPQVWLEVANSVFDPVFDYWTTKVEIADINSDGLPDILFANVGGVQAGTPDSIVPNQAYLNDAGTQFLDVSAEVFGENALDTGRAIKAHDLDNDGDTDIIVATTWATQSRLYLQDDMGAFVESSGQLPQQKLSAGDVELGDVDGDGDLDIVLSDWGPAPVGLAGSPGGVTRLWLNDGAATFTDATNQSMPAIAVNWSWDHEFIDIDNDWDLDLLIACRSCATGSLLFVNDGLGDFTNATPGNLPQALGNVDFEIMDIDGDGYVDTYTLQDGPGFRNRILLNNQNGGFEDATALWWGPADNPPSYDYAGAFVDFDSDGLPDIVLGAFSTFVDRLMRNDGSTYKRVTDPSMVGPLVTDGTYSIGVADFNQDGKIDFVFGEGENSNFNRVLYGEDIAPDTGAPVIGAHELTGAIEPDSKLTFHGRIHDNKTPNKPHDWQFVGVQWVTDGGSFDNPGDITSYELDWYGEHLWRTGVLDGEELVLPTFETVIEMRVCAIDAAGNETCIGLVQQFLCGDGKVNSPNEECDGEDGCEPDCTWTVQCGNGIVQDGEQCDDGNLIDGDGCQSDCTLTPPETDSITESDSDITTTSTSTSDSVTDTSTDTDTTATTDATATETASTSDSESDSATTGFNGELDDDGCGCTTTDSRGAGTGLLLLGLLALRRRRR